MKNPFFRTFALIIAIVTLFCALSITASATSSAYTHEDWTYTTDGSKATLLAYLGNNTVINVPAELDGLPVTVLDKTFQSNSKVTEINLPASIVKIVPTTFECDNLAKITVAAGNTSYASRDGVLYSKDYKTLVAYPCGGATRFAIPAEVEHIADYAFFRCYKLLSVTMDNNVTTIGDNAFSFCWNLRSVRLSDNLTSIAGEAFRNCGWLTTINLPVNITSIGTNALLGFLGSDSAPRYHLADGVYCVKDSYAERYIKGIRITSVLKLVPDIRSDIPTGITAEKQFGKGVRVDVAPLTSGTEFDLIEAFKLTDSSLLGSAAYSLTATSKGAPKAFSDIKVIVPIPNGFASSISHMFFLNDGTPTEITEKTVVYSDNRIAYSFNLPSTGVFSIIQKFAYTIPGDVDGDGSVTTSDARYTLRAAAKLDILIAEQLPAADIDGTPGISTTDARKILRKAARLEP